ncbi:dTDP-glucose 4,6-dehydratase [Cytobacillus firmus]|uniref:dTDP-glucose 4,6-dehydratase n=1 Tax=Cytobacillus firmus TaxID=1399 RepID=UPI00216243FB|nr:dTDP-glucose 4,6-dehydratase [Cytobacillus firmus]MCS0673883.1 dTDP-glucose 4,6-dehydratase [Cytobacillus firmus]
MNKHLLVTGGAGFIGANFISYILSNSNYSITNIDSLTYAGNYKNMEPFQKSNRYRFIKCDISNENKLKAAFDQEYEAIINFAAESHVDRSIIDATPFITTNIKGTFNLLQAVLSGKSKKMIQISTDEVYGSLQPSDPPFIEESPLAPNNPYSASKAGADLLVRSFFKTHQLPLVITRCGNNYGPMQHAEKFIPKTIQNALQDKSIPLYGDGLNIRDWIYVIDHCRAIHMVLEKGTAGEIYNIGGSGEKTNREVIESILNKIGKSIDLVKKIEDRKGHDRRYAIDFTKISQELGWKPSVSFEEGIQKTIDWYKQFERR